MKGETYTHLALIFFAVFIIYLLYKSFSERKYIESFVDQTPNVKTSSDSKDTATNIDNQATKILDGLLISKYRANYEDVIENTIKLTDASILSQVLNPDTSKSTDPKTVMEKISTLNQLHQFKTTLQDSLTFLDKQ